MRTKVALLLILCLLAALLSGCGTKEQAPGAAEDGDGEVPEDIFDYQGPPEVLGSVIHGGGWPGRDENMPLEYGGGELEVPYRAQGDGTGRNVGFLLFLNGVPQPYRLNGQGEYGYMHPFTLREDNVEEEFTFSFVPVTGKAGDTVSFVVANLFNASFEPDMIDTSGFGLYGDAVTAIHYIHFTADPEPGGPEAEPLKALTGLRVTNELMTAEFIEKNLGPQSGMTTSDGQTREDMLDKTVYIFDTYDGREELNDLDVTGRGSLHVAVDICGMPGITYRVSFFADHVPLTDGESFYWDVTLEKSKTARVEADLELSGLEGVTTFYAVACTTDGEDDSARRYGLLKTKSLPIWSQDRLGEDPGGEENTGGAATVADTPEVMDDSVRSLWYGEGDDVLVRRSDGLRLIDMSTGEVLAEGDMPELTGASFYPFRGGFCAVGEGERDETATLSEAGSGDTGTVCVFLDDSLSQTGSVSLSALAGEDKNILCAAVSPDGERVAFSVMNDGIYILSRDSGKAELLCDLGGEKSLGMVSNLWFDGDGERVIFADNSHFGTVELEGGGLTFTAIEDFDPQGAVGCAGGKVFFNENFFTASGAMAVADVDEFSSVTYRHSPQEGKGDIYVSRDGGYFATTAFDGSLTLRIYETMDDSLCLKYTVAEDGGGLLDAAPGVLILDDLKLCLLKLGGYSDVPAKVVALSFE